MPINKSNMKTKNLLYTGSIIPIIFWATTIICGFILGNYNHLSGLVSELGALGTTTQYIFIQDLSFDVHMMVWMIFAG